MQALHRLGQLVRGERLVELGHRGVGHHGWGIIERADQQEPDSREIGIITDTVQQFGSCHVGQVVGGNHQADGVIAKRLQGGATAGYLVDG